MALTNNWDAAKEASPAGTDLRSQGDDRMREIQLNVRERLIQDHEIGDSGLSVPAPSTAQKTAKDTGWHKWLTLFRQASAPANPDSGYGRLYNLAADALIRFKDSAGVIKTLVDENSTQSLSGKSFSDAVTFDVSPLIGTGSSFAATRITTDQSLNGTLNPILIFNDDSTSPNFDDGGNYNLSTGRFTAPVDGNYWFFVFVQFQNLDTTFGTGVNLFINGVDKENIVVITSDTGLINSGGKLVKLSSGDLVDVRVGSIDTSFTLRKDASYFSGNIVVR